MKLYNINVVFSYPDAIYTLFTTKSKVRADKYKKEIADFINYKINVVNDYWDEYSTYSAEEKHHRKYTKKYNTIPKNLKYLKDLAKVLHEPNDSIDDSLFENSELVVEITESEFCTYKTEIFKVLNKKAATTDLENITGR